MRIILTALLGFLSLVSSSRIPQFALLQSKVKPNQKGGDKSAFDNLYLSITGLLTGQPQVHPILRADNAYAVTWQLNPSVPATPTTPALFELLYNITDNQPGYEYITTLEFGGVLDALWQVVTLYPSSSKKVQASLQNRFYVNQTGSGQQLLWSNDEKDEVFESWLVCDYFYGYPQLLFTVKTTGNSDANLSAPLPCSCALVDLDIIPIV